MYCVIAAGGHVPPADPLYKLTQGKPKALLEIAGRPMVEHVVGALQGARAVDAVIIVGLDPAAADGLQFVRPVTFLPDAGGLVENMVAGVERVRAERPDDGEVLLCTADIPLLTSDVVDDFVDRCRPFDRLAYYNFVTQETLEAAFPGARRTYVRLRDTAVAGGDIVLAQTRILDTNRELWRQLANARKHAWRLALTIGPWTLLRLATRRLAVKDVEDLAGRVIGAPVCVLVNPHPELAMDADKPHQVALLREHMS